MIFIKILRFLLFPFSVLYGLITFVRNFMYDWGLLKSTRFDIPVIAVGNLSAGGTGKTPQIEYLIQLLQDKYNIAVLSRGYKRKSKGFVLADHQTSVVCLGDEPYQFYKKFPKITVAVDNDRVAGIQKISTLKPNTNLILLDDAYQHRKVKADFYILLTAYSNLFYKDFMLPTGNLREFWWGKKRADIIVVTKCPEHLSKDEQQKIIKRIHPAKNQYVFFSKIAYANNVLGTKKVLLKDLIKENILLITGIANPKLFVNYLTSLGATFEHLQFADHHHFTEAELDNIKKKSQNKKVLTTEKDYVRLEQQIDGLAYLPIKTTFINHSKKFDQEIFSMIESLLVIVLLYF